jgi:hypothetical protein
LFNVLVLTQFILRLSFGMALGMALTSPRQVTSGYYRNHLYVLLGLNVLDTMAALGSAGQLPLWPPLAAAILSYVGAVAWLYEKPRLGISLLLLISAVALAGALLVTVWPSDAAPWQTALAALDPISGGLVLGLTLAAMFLGHWYLNTPTMAIGPLEKLVYLLAAAVLFRGAVEGLLLATTWSQTGLPATDTLLFVALRWLSGIFGVLALAVMTLKTLWIPNTQSATGILYVAVIATFLGELTSMLLAASLVPGF